MKFTVNIGDKPCEVRFWKEHVVRDCIMTNTGLESYWKKIVKDDFRTHACKSMGELLSSPSICNFFRLSLRTNCCIHFDNAEFTASVVLNPKDKPNTFLARKYALQKALLGFSMNKEERMVVWNTFLESSKCSRK